MNPDAPTPVVNPQNGIELAKTMRALAAAELTKPPRGPIPHDGWTSRKIRIGLGAGLTFFVTSTAMLLASGLLELGFFSADHWLSTQMMATTPILGVTMGFLTAEKWPAKNR